MDIWTLQRMGNNLSYRSVEPKRSGGPVIMKKIIATQPLDITMTVSRTYHIVVFDRQYWLKHPSGETKSIGTISDLTAFIEEVQNAKDYSPTGS